MIRSKNDPALRALRDLMALYGDARDSNEAWLIALTWMAGLRQLSLNMEYSISTMRKLLEPDFWEGPVLKAIPRLAINMLVNTTFAEVKSSSTAVEAVKIVERLASELGADHWDVIDAPWYRFGYWSVSTGYRNAIAPELAEFLIESLGAKPGQTVWIPYDGTGQLVLRALRRGLHVKVDGPATKINQPRLLQRLHLSLLIAIEPPRTTLMPRIEFDARITPSGQKELFADYLICTPPLGKRIDSELDLQAWEEGNRHLDVLETQLQWRHESVERSQRIDTWATSNLWPRASERAVFLVHSTFLFGLGNEARQRERLLMHERLVRSIMMLPVKLTAVTSKDVALVVIERATHAREVRLIDATALMERDGPSTRSDSTFQFRRALELFNSSVGDGDMSVDVPIGELWENKLSLLPTRYLGHNMLHQRERGVPLGEFVHLVRPYTGKSDGTGVMATVIGVSEQERWRPFVGNDAEPGAKSDELKRIYLPGRRLDNFALRENDILLAHKGRIGQTVLIGAVPTFDEPIRYYEANAQLASTEPDSRKVPFITNQSCIALRVKDKGIDALSLFLFFRSANFQRQIDALRVGSVISHVTPDEILHGVFLPPSVFKDRDRNAQTYQRLCALEEQMYALAAEMVELRGSLDRHDVLA